MGCSAQEFCTSSLVPEAPAKNAHQGIDSCFAAAAGQSVSAASSGAVSLASACCAKAASTAGLPSRFTAASGSASSCFKDVRACRLACTPLPGCACTASQHQASKFQWMQCDGRVHGQPAVALHSSLRVRQQLCQQGNSPSPGLQAPAQAQLRLQCRTGDQHCVSYFSAC